MDRPSPGRWTPSSAPPQNDHKAAHPNRDPGPEAAPFSSTWASAAGAAGPIGEAGPDAWPRPAGPASSGLAAPSFTPTISPEEIASYLGTSPWWVREQARSGRVHHLRLGKGRIRFLTEHVHELIALCTVQATEPTSTGGATTPSVPTSLAALGATRRSQRVHGTHAADGP
jgi:excisionase family DNA binding protein